MDGQILRIGVEALEEVEGPVLFLAFEEGTLFEVIVGGSIGETYWEGVGVDDIGSFQEQLVDGSYFNLGNHCFLLLLLFIGGFVVIEECIGEMDQVFMMEISDWQK